MKINKKLSAAITLSLMLGVYGSASAADHYLSGIDGTAGTFSVKDFANLSASIYKLAVCFLPPLIISGVLDSSIKIESISSTIQKSLACSPMTMSEKNIVLTQGMSLCSFVREKC